MNIVSILETAKSYIDTPEKWHKGNWCNEDGSCMCTMGAMVKALGSDPLEILNDTSTGYDSVKHFHEHPATEVLKKGFGLCGDAFERSIATINDRKDTTHEQIMGYFDKAIALAKSEEQPA